MVCAAGQHSRAGPGGGGAGDQAKGMSMEEMPYGVDLEVMPSPAPLATCSSQES